MLNSRCDSVQHRDTHHDRHITRSDHHQHLTTRPHDRCESESSAGSLSPSTLDHSPLPPQPPRSLRWAAPTPWRLLGLRGSHELLHALETLLRVLHVTRLQQLDQCLVRGGFGSRVRVRVGSGVEVGVGVRVRVRVRRVRVRVRRLRLRLRARARIRARARARARPRVRASPRIRMRVGSIACFEWIASHSAASHPHSPSWAGIAGGGPAAAGLRFAAAPGPGPRAGGPPATCTFHVRVRG